MRARFLRTPIRHSSVFLGMRLSCLDRHPRPTQLYRYRSWSHLTSLRERAPSPYPRDYCARLLMGEGTPLACAMPGMHEMPWFLNFLFKAFTLKKLHFER